jgi:hypothetical protein
MQLPNFAVLKSYRGLQRHRALHPALYERTVRRAGSYYRYYSKQPGLCIAEAVAQQALTSPDYIFIQQVADHSYFAVRIKNGLPYIQSGGALNNVLDELGADSKKVSHVFSALNIPDTEHVNNGWDLICTPVESIPKDILNSYKLHNKQVLQRIVISAVTGCVIIVAALAFWPDDKQETVATSPWQEWRAQTIKPASSVLMSAAAVSSQLTFLPDDYELTRIELPSGSGSLAAVFSATSATPNRAALQGWLQENPNFLAAYDATTSSMQFEVLQQTRATVVDAPTLAEYTYQTLANFEPKSLTFEPISSSPTVVTKIHAHWDAQEFALLTFVAEIFEHQPVYIDTLTIEPVKAAPGQFNISITFNVETL